MIPRQSGPRRLMSERLPGASLSSYVGGMPRRVRADSPLFIDDAAPD